MVTVKAKTEWKEISILIRKANAVAQCRNKGKVIV